MVVVTFVVVVVSVALVDVNVVMLNGGGVVSRWQL